MEEVKRLKEAFMRAQSADFIQKITESQCVEIIGKIRELQLIELISTLDGKEFLTPNRVLEEVRQQLFLHKGRISASELQLLIGVDISAIDAAIHKHISASTGLHCVQNELLTDAYLDDVASQADALLQEKGFISIADISHHVNLPLSFIQTAMEARIDTLLHCRVDPGSKGKLYTDAFIRRQLARIRGVFRAISVYETPLYRPRSEGQRDILWNKATVPARLATAGLFSATCRSMAVLSSQALRPTSISAILQRHDFHDIAFQSALDELVASGDIPGSVKRGVYVPQIYVRTRAQAASSFLDQNGYIGATRKCFLAPADYEQLKRLGIEDRHSFCKNRDGLELPFTFVSAALVKRIDALAEDALSADGYCDIRPLMPSQCGDADASALVTQLPCIKGIAGAQVVAGCAVVTDTFLGNCLKVFENDLRQRAFTQIATGGVKVKDDGSIKRRQSNQKGTPTPTEPITKQEIGERLSKSSKASDMECEFWLAVADLLRKPLAEMYDEYLQSAFVDNALNRQVGPAEEKFIKCYTAFSAFAHGATKVTSDQKSIRKHLLRTVGTELVKAIYEREAFDSYVAVAAEQLANRDSRTGLASVFSPRVKAALSQLEDDIQGHDTSALLGHLGENVAVLQWDPARAADKATESKFLTGHMEALKNELKVSKQPAATLHLAAMILFQTKTGCGISAPAKCVPGLVSTLETHMEADDHAQLAELQRRIMASVSPQGGINQSQVIENLQELQQKVRNIALQESGVTDS